MTSNLVSSLGNTLTPKPEKQTMASDEEKKIDAHDADTDENDETNSATSSENFDLTAALGKLDHAIALMEEVNQAEEEAKDDAILPETHEIIANNDSNTDNNAAAENDSKKSSNDSNDTNSNDNSKRTASPSDNFSLASSIASSISISSESDNHSSDIKTWSELAKHAEKKPTTSQTSSPTPSSSSSPSQLSPEKQPQPPLPTTTSTEQPPPEMVIRVRNTDGSYSEHAVDDSLASSSDEQVAQVVELLRKKITSRDSQNGNDSINGTIEDFPDLHKYPSSSSQTPSDCGSSDTTVSFPGRRRGSKSSNITTNEELEIYIRDNDDTADVSADAKELLKYLISGHRRSPVLAEGEDDDVDNVSNDLEREEEDEEEERSREVEDVSIAVDIADDVDKKKISPPSTPPSPLPSNDSDIPDKKQKMRQDQDSPHNSSHSGDDSTIVETELDFVCDDDEREEEKEAAWQSVPITSDVKVAAGKKKRTQKKPSSPSASVKPPALSVLATSDEDEADDNNEEEKVVKFSPKNETITIKRNDNSGKSKRKGKSKKTGKPSTSATTHSTPSSASATSVSTAASPSASSASSASSTHTTQPQPLPPFNFTFLFIYIAVLLAASTALRFFYHPKEHQRSNIPHFHFDDFVTKESIESEQNLHCEIAYPRPGEAINHFKMPLTWRMSGDAMKADEKVHINIAFDREVHYRRTMQITSHNLKADGSIEGELVMDDIREMGFEKGLHELTIDLTIGDHFTKADRLFLYMPNNSVVAPTHSLSSTTTKSRPPTPPPKSAPSMKKEAVKNTVLTLDEVKITFSYPENNEVIVGDTVVVELDTEGFLIEKHKEYITVLIRIDGNSDNEYVLVDSTNTLSGLLVGRHHMEISAYMKSNGQLLSTSEVSFQTVAKPN